MALKSWSILSFAGAAAGTPVTQTLLQSNSSAIVLLSLLASNLSGTTPATVTITRQSGANVEKFKWQITLPAGGSPFAIDSKMIFVNGDKLVVRSDNPSVSIDASGDES